MTFFIQKCYKMHCGVRLHGQNAYYVIFWNIAPKHWIYMDTGYCNSFYFYVPATKWPGHNSVTHARNSEIKQLWPLFFAMLWDIDLIFGMWVYNDKLQINFTICSGPRYGPWTLKFGQIYSCHHFISLWFEILTWFLVWECIIISYRSTLKFICYS